MSGKLGLSTPWARDALQGEDRKDVTEAIPDGWQLGVSMEANRSKWILWTVDPAGKVSPKLRVSASMSLRSACFYALRHWRLGDRIVTVDLEGNIRSITEAD